MQNFYSHFMHDWVAGHIRRGIALDKQLRPAPLNTVGGDVGAPKHLGAGTGTDTDADADTGAGAGTDTGAGAGTGSAAITTASTTEGEVVCDTTDTFVFPAATATTTRLDRLYYPEADRMVALLATGVRPLWPWFFHHANAHLL